MIGKDLATLDELEEGTKREAGERQTQRRLLQRRRSRPVGTRSQPFDLDDPSGRGGRAGRPARLRPDRGRPAALRRRPQRLRRTLIDGGEPSGSADPRAALDHKIAFASENRKAEGLIGDLTVRANIVLAMQAARGWLRQIPRSQQDELADKYIKALDIRPANPNALVRNLSGGNQQKVLLARWLITQPQAADP